MSSSEQHVKPPRRRLSREERGRQLIEEAWRLVREEGTEALTLARLAEQAGVTKPVVYDHFVTRAGLLAALYGEYDARQTALMMAALAACEATLEAKARVIARAIVECILTQGREIPGVSAALSSSPELEKVKCSYESAFMEKVRAELAPFTAGAPLSLAGMRGMLGAADGLSHAAALGEISAEDAEEELFETIKAMVARASVQA